MNYREFCKLYKQGLIVRISRLQWVQYKKFYWNDDSIDDRRISLKTLWSHYQDEMVTLDYSHINKVDLDKIINDS